MNELQAGEQRLLQGDWRDVVKTIKDDSVDLLLTDPPYGTTNLSFDKQRVNWSSFWREIHRVCKPSAPLVLFASGKFVPELLNSNLENFRYELVWEKTMSVGFLDANRRPLRAHEQILIFCRRWKGSTYNPQKIVGKRHTIGGNKKKPGHYSGANNPTPARATDLYHPRSVLKHANVGGGKSLHPTAKPLELVRWLVRSYSNEGAFIFEPFAGSGTTLAAAMIEKRRCLGTEINSEYYNTARARLIELEATLNNGRPGQ